MSIEFISKYIGVFNCYATDKIFDCINVTSKERLKLTKKMGQWTDKNLKLSLAQYPINVFLSNLIKNQPTISEMLDIPKKLKEIELQNEKVQILDSNISIVLDLSEIITTFGGFLRFMRIVSKKYNISMIYDYDILSQWNMTNSMDILTRLLYKMGVYHDMTYLMFFRILSLYVPNTEDVPPIMKQISANEEICEELSKYFKKLKEMNQLGFNEFVDFKQEILDEALFLCNDVDEMQEILTNCTQV